MTDLSGAERLKYERIWQHERYRKFSPGEKLAHQALQLMEGSVIDFGCGTGRAAKIFQDAGLSVRGVDIADNCLEVDIPFVRACLWDMPVMAATWGYCTDVMEHIPEEKVAAVLDQIKARVEKAFFQIALRKDSFGPQVLGEPLHLTVKPAEWWEEELSKRWDVKTTAKKTNAIFECR